MSYLRMILLTFCGNDLEQLRYFKCVVLGFEAVCGLKINLAKSELLPVGIVPEVEELAQILGCKVSNLPMRYLGWPWVLNLNQKQYGISFFRRWKGNYLGRRRFSFQREVDLHSLLSLPIYFLSLFPIKVSIANSI